MANHLIKLGKKANSTYAIHIDVNGSIIDMKAYCRVHPNGLAVNDLELAALNQNGLGKMIADGKLDLVTDKKLPGMVKQVETQTKVIPVEAPKPAPVEPPKAEEPKVEEPKPEPKRRKNPQPAEKPEEPKEEK